MSNPKELLDQAVEALRDGNTESALELARSIVMNHYDSDESVAAKRIIAKLYRADRSSSAKTEDLVEQTRRIQSDVKRSSQTRESTTSKYSTARAVALFLEIDGWLFVVASLVVAIFLFSTGVMLPWFLAAILLAIFAGLIQIACAQVVRATVDNANATRAILAEIWSLRLQSE